MTNKQNDNELADAAVYAAGGAAAGAGVSSVVGGMGLAVGGTAVVCLTCSRSGSASESRSHDEGCVKIRCQTDRTE